MHSIVKRGLRGVALLTPVKLMLLRNVRSVISFTFDDFSVSAGQVGLEILHRYDVRGTYYVAGGLEDGSIGNNKLYTADELKMVVSNGHEIGCHTYGHTSAQDVTISELNRQLDRNAVMLRERYGVDEIHSFAFPYGDATLPSKLLRARAGCGTGPPGRSPFAMGRDGIDCIDRRPPDGRDGTRRSSFGASRCAPPPATAPRRARRTG